jgi:hypothetical protein
MYVFVLTYNESKLFTSNYNDEFVEENFKSKGIKFIILDNGNQPLMKKWCETHDFIYYSSEYNIGSSGGYNWIFKVAHMMGLDSAILMQSDVEISNSNPLFLTDNLVRSFGDSSFICWPQELNNFWLGDDNKMKPYEHDIPNLGNMVGFNPNTLYKKNCYFDENYVVTHFDDVEFIQWNYHHKIMGIINASHIIKHTVKQYYEKKYNEQIDTILNTFVVKSDSFHYKVHHAGPSMDPNQDGTEKSYSFWFDYNKSYYDLFLSRNFNRLGYDHTRWTNLGYPKYPVENELIRFSNQNPDLIINYDLSKILNE